MYAAGNGKLEIVKNLIKNGANVNAADKYNKQYHNMLQYSEPTDDKANIIGLLIGAGADPNTKNDYGKTPLMYVVRTGNLKLVQLLIEKVLM